MGPLAAVSNFDSILIRSEARDEPRTPYTGWTVNIEVNGKPYRTSLHLQDFLADLEGRHNYQGEGETFLESYLDESILPQRKRRLSDHALDTRERMMAEYATQLWEALEFRLGHEPFQFGAVGCHINVEEPDANLNAPTVHGIAWELLEAKQLDAPYEINVTRTVRFRRKEVLNHESLGDIQCHLDRTFKILLVIARDLRDRREIEPDIAQSTLVRIQQQFNKRERHRVLLEVVRPSSILELENHLKNRYEAHHCAFNIVHFDLHGGIIDDEEGRKRAVLNFSNFKEKDPENGLGLTGAKAARVANVLRHYKVDHVVLNACLSATCSHGHVANLSRVFLNYGVRQISAMWHYVHYRTAKMYVKVFYESLLIHRKSFTTSAHAARKFLRTNQNGLDNSRWREGLGVTDKHWAFQDDFVCVTYVRNDHEPSQPTSREDNSQHGHALSGPEESPSLRERPSADTNSTTPPKFLVVKHDRPEKQNIFLRARESFASRFKRVTYTELEPLPAPQIDPNLGNSGGSGPESFKFTLRYLDLEIHLKQFKVLYVGDSFQSEKQKSMITKTDQLVRLWLDTNMIGLVSYYDGDSFVRSRRPRPSHGPIKKEAVTYHLGRTESHLSPLGGNLHIIDGLDNLLENVVRRGLQDVKKARRHLEEFIMNLDSHDYLMFRGGMSKKWWTAQGFEKGEFWFHGMSTR